MEKQEMVEQCDYFYAVAVALREKGGDGIQVANLFIGSQNKLTSEDALRGAEMALHGELVDDEMRTGRNWEIAGSAVLDLNSVMGLDDEEECDCEDCKDEEAATQAIRFVRWCMEYGPYLIGAGLAALVFGLWNWWRG